jgi:Tol biopolymer transport system component
MRLIGRWIAVAGMLVVAGPLAGQTPVPRKVAETLLAPFPPEVRESSVISPDARHVAYVRPVQGGQQAVLDGKEQKTYAKVAELAFSPDGKTLAYAAQSGQQWLIVAGGQEQTPYTRVGPPVFSPDGKHLAYVALLPDGNRAVVVDGKPGKPCESVFEGRIAFSPDGHRMAYGAKRPEGWFLVVGDQETGPYEFLGSATGLVFSRDGARLAAAAMVKQKWFVVLEGKPQTDFENVADLAFSPDGKRLAYVAQQGGKWIVVLDGKPGEPFDAIGEGTLTFSPDGKRLAFAAQSNRAWSAILDGKAGKKHEGVNDLRFSPDGQKLAYVATDAKAQRVVVGEQEERTFQRIVRGSLVFSPGGRLAYIARSGRGTFVVADGKRRPTYDLAGHLIFAPDGRRPVYAATRGDKATTVVDDQEAAHRYDAIWLPAGEKLIFVSRTKFRYLGLKDGKLFAVEESLE